MTDKLTELEERFDKLEERINSLQTSALVVESQPAEPVEIEHHHPESIEAEHHYSKRYKKLKTVEDALEEESDLLSSVQKILGRA